MPAAVSPSAYALIGLMLILGGIGAVLTFAMLRFVAAARAARHARSAGADTALLSAALQDAVAKLRTQERAMAARAEASERLSGEIISSLTAGALVAGLDGEIRTLNPAGRRILHLPDVTPYLRSPAEQPLLDVVDECLKTAQAIVRRGVTLEAAGGKVHLGVTVSPLFDGDGHLHGAICLFTDLTAVKDLEEQLLLKDSLATVGELTAGIAHEFRNGLATIHGYSKLLDLKALPEAYRPYVAGIRAETESLSQVVTNFLNFARPAQLTLTRVDLGVLCDRAAEEIRADAVALGGEVIVAGEFGAVEGDEVLLRQAFSNLLRNAVEACAGGTVPASIAVRSEIDRSLKVSRITVTDNGPGIPADSRERVFQPFFTSKRNGTGLGLALVQKIVVFHNGRIVAGTSPAGGASLQVTLPLG
jgi:nitrogen fixation/metabolism regulation signal transduction histidine kinase